MFSSLPDVIAWLKTRSTTPEIRGHVNANALPGPASTGLQEVITTRQFILMALGSSIGAGLLLSTGQALAVGGAIPLFIAFAVVGLAVWITMCALGELSAHIPVKGSFYEFSVRFISPAWGFAMGWNYVINFIIVVPFEIIVMIMCTRFWDPNISAFYLVPCFIFGLVVIYSLGARWFAEAENVFGVLKIAVILMFVFTAICILAGGVATDTRPAEEMAYRSWPAGAFKNGAPGFLFVFMTAGIAYGGTEMLGLTAAECRSPRYVMSLASRLVAGRIALLYLVPVLILGLVLKIDLSPVVTSSDGITKQDDLSHNAYISPFVLVVSQAGIPVLPDIMNAIIVIAFFSMANASVFASSRALQAISARGMGPRFCAYIYRGRPVGALAVIFAFSLLAFAKATPQGDDVFVWLVALASCSNYLTWGSICIAHVRYRLALQRQRKPPSNLIAYRSSFGIWGSVMATVIFAFGLTAQIAAAARSPLPDPPPVTASFAGLLVVAVFWGGYMIWKRDSTLLVPLHQIEVVPEEEVDTISNVVEIEAPAA